MVEVEILFAVNETEMKIDRIGVTKRWSDGVVHNGVAYFVEVPDDATLSPREQIKQVLDQLDRRLTQLGSNRESMLMVSIYLPYPEDLEEFNALWDDFVPFGHAPSRACTHPKLAAAGYRVELVVTAAVH